MILYHPAYQKRANRLQYCARWRKIFDWRHILLLTLSIVFSNIWILPHINRPAWYLTVFGLALVLPLTPLWIQMGLGAMARRWLKRLPAVEVPEELAEQYRRIVRELDIREDVDAFTRFRLFEELTPHWILKMHRETTSDQKARFATLIEKRMRETLGPFADSRAAAHAEAAFIARTQADADRATHDATVEATLRAYGV